MRISYNESRKSTNPRHSLHYLVENDHHVQIVITVEKLYDPKLFAVYSNLTVDDLMSMHSPAARFHFEFTTWMHKLYFLRAVDSLTNNCFGICIVYSNLTVDDLMSMHSSVERFRSEFTTWMHELYFLRALKSPTNNCLGILIQSSFICLCKLYVES